VTEPGNMRTSKALSCLTIALVLLFPKMTSAQAPAGQAPTAPNGASPRAPAGAAVQKLPAPTKSTAPLSTNDDVARPAPVGGEPEATTATYGDWLLRCQRTTTGGASQRVCDVSQTVQAQGQQNPLLQLTFGHPVPKEPVKLTIYAPVDVSFPSVVRLSIDEKGAQPVELTWRRCQPGGCVADLEIQDELLKRWRAQVGRGVIKIVDATGREVTIPFSFRGLAQALDALPRS
jgi:invasion protein IalB